jgi:hypothetical protein
MSIPLLLNAALLDCIKCQCIANLAVILQYFKNRLFLKTIIISPELTVLTSSFIIPCNPILMFYL